jgi:hypothetical protein
VPDAGLIAYVAAVEACLTRARGKPHVLSPPDFSLVRELHAASVPLRRVLDAVERVCAASPRAASLAGCRRELQAAATRARAPSWAAAAEASASLLEQARARLERLRDALEGSNRPALASVAREARRLCAAWERDAERLPPLLQALDARVSEAALAALDPAERAELQARAAPAVRRQRGRVADDALDAGRRRALARAARERLGLPAPES